MKGFTLFTVFIIADGHKYRLRTALESAGFEAGIAANTLVRLPIHYVISSAQCTGWAYINTFTAAAASVDCFGLWQYIQLSCIPEKKQLYDCQGHLRTKGQYSVHQPYSLPLTFLSRILGSLPIKPNTTVS